MYYPHAFTERIHSQNELLKQHLMISGVPIKPDSEQHSHHVGSNHRTWCRFFLRQLQLPTVQHAKMGFKAPHWKHHPTWNHIKKGENMWKWPSRNRKGLQYIKRPSTIKICISKKTKVQQQLMNIKDEILHQQMDYELSPVFQPRGAAASLSICENASAFGVCFGWLHVTGIQLFFNNGRPKRQQSQHSLNLENETMKKTPLGYWEGCTQASSLRINVFKENIAVFGFHSS